MALGVPDMVGPSDIVQSNVKVNTLFVAAIFNIKHGLEELTKEEYDAAQMLDDEQGDPEELTFSRWINSLGIEDVYVQGPLGEACRDGVMLPLVLNHVCGEGAVDMKKISKAPDNDFKRNINSSALLDSCKTLGIKVIGVGGPDITKGDKKGILAIVWQIMRKHYMKIIGDKTEDDIVKWANGQVGGNYKNITNLKDQQMKDSKFLMHLCAAIEPRAINWDILSNGETDEDYLNNAKYLISVAKKLGAVIFATKEDIVKVNAKHMFIFIAVLMSI